MPEGEVDSGSGKEPTAPFFENADTVDDSMHRLVYENMDFARQSMKKLFGERLWCDEDFVQSTYTGLVEAAARFKPEGSAQFQTLAYIYMRRAVIEEVQNRHFLKRNIYRKIKRWHEAEDLLTQRLQRFPTRTEVAEELELEIVEAADISGLAEAYPPYSITRPANGTDGQELIQMVPTDDQDMEEMIVDKIHLAQLMEEIEAYLAELVPTQRQVVEMHFLGGLAISQIAQDQGVSFQAVNQRKNIGLANLSEKIVG